MRKVIPGRRIIPLLRASINTLATNRIILFPFVVIAFIQLLVLEILYFSPRYPLVQFFGPIIRKIFSENYLHYPYNFYLLPKLFQKAQIPIYIFISSLFIAMAISIISTINSEKTVVLKAKFKDALSVYVHVVTMALITYLVISGIFHVHELILKRAFAIRSTSGQFYMLKRFVIDSFPYVNLLISICVTTIFAYVMPIIVIDKKKVFSAVIENFKTLWGSFWFTFILVLIPSLLFIPVLLLRRTINLEEIVPETSVLILIASIFVIIAIDAITYTALTTYYLLKKELS